MLCYAKSLQSCPTLCDPIDGSLPGSPVPGILQGRTLEWVAISFSNAWKWKVKVKSLSRVWIFATPWTAAHQAPPSMGFSRQEYWSGVSLPSPKVEAIREANKFCEEWKRWKILRICLLHSHLSINVSCPSDLHYHYSASPQSWLSIIDVNDCFWGKGLLRLLTESCGFVYYQKCLRRCLSWAYKKHLLNKCLNK